MGDMKYIFSTFKLGCGSERRDRNSIKSPRECPFHCLILPGRDRRATQRSMQKLMFLILEILLFLAVPSAISPPNLDGGKDL